MASPARSGPWPPARSSPWLFGALPDLALGCGLGYGLIFLVFAIGGKPLRLAQPAFIMPLLAVVLSGPHYGATLLRVYERRSDRRAYALFSVWATLLVVAAFAMSLRSAVFASWLFTLYITWSPWHYTGQNYGLSVMFLRRGGAEVTPLAKRLLHTSFVSSFLITFLVLHNMADVANYNPSGVGYDTSLISLRHLGLPNDLVRSALLVVTCVYGASLIGAFALLARASSWRPLLPALALVATQALWFTLPFSLPFWGIRTGIDPLDAGTPALYVFWIAIGHAVQYLWVTSYYARASSNWTGYSRYLGKTLAAGAAVWTLPAMLFAPDVLGDREFGAGLAIMVAAAVNIHHFILDGAIWKLRSSRIAGVLIRAQKEGAERVDAAPRLWPRRVVWAVCGAFFVLRVGATELESPVFPALLRSGHLAWSESALDALAWLGRDSSRSRSLLAGAYARKGRSEAAEAQYLRSLELRPSLRSWEGVAGQRARRGDWKGVVGAYEAGQKLGPSPLGFRKLAMRAYYRTANPDRARNILEHVAPDRADSVRAYTSLATVAYHEGDLPTAVHGYRHALEIEPDHAIAENGLAWILATADDPQLRAPREAVALAESAARGTKPPDANYYDTLAAAYAADGRLADAIAAESRALEIANGAGDEAMAHTARTRLAKYRSDSPPAANLARGAKDPGA